MLVLSRKKRERIFIADDIVLTVIGISKAGTVRLGIEAPRDMKVQREEVAVAADQHLADGRLGP
jgi:carbon storage regulator